MHRRIFTAGLIALPFTAPLRTYAQEASRSSLREALLSIKAESAPDALQQKDVRRAPAQEGQADYEVFLDNGQIRSRFGDAIDDPTVVGLVDLMSDTGESNVMRSFGASGEAAPVGYVSYQALTRYAYISHASGAGAGNEYQYAYVPFALEESFSVLPDRLVRAQESWRAFIDRYGASAVTRL